MASRIRLSVLCLEPISDLADLCLYVVEYDDYNTQISDDKIAYVVAKFISQSNTNVNGKGIIHRVVSYKCSSL